MTQPKIKFIHLRDHEFVELPAFGKFVKENETVTESVVAVKGGCTIAYFVDRDKIYYAYSECCPKDNFNKKLGRKISSGRLAKDPLEGEYRGEPNSEICKWLINNYLRYKAKFSPDATNYRF